jgi:hypothetical protein
MFEALTRGYLDAGRGFLTRAEISHLVFAGKLISFTIGIRFLTDYLNGDTYFRVHRPYHNLDRCRTQFKLVASIEEQEDAMQRVVDRYSRDGDTRTIKRGDTRAIKRSAATRSPQSAPESGATKPGSRPGQRSSES